MSKTQTHPYLLKVSRSLCNLLLSKRLTETEALHVTLSVLGLYDIRMAFWDELNAIVEQDLPDTGCRPTGPEVFAFLDNRSKPRDFDLALGYLHRVREYAERLETKYGMGGAA